jgi:hypothetical protein
MHSDPATGGRDFMLWPRTPTDKGPTEGNHRLTALTGSLLVPLVALIFMTGLFMDAWWHIHYAVGFVLVPLVALKLAGTGYRALRYYTRDPIYRAAGPPELLPRLLAPLMVLSVVSALATGVALFVERSRGGVLGTLHTDAAVAGAFLVGAHLLTYLPDALATAARELRARLSRPASLRITAVVIALILGIILAGATYSAGVWPARHHDQREGSGYSSSGVAGMGTAIARPARYAYLTEHASRT